MRRAGWLVILALLAGCAELQAPAERAPGQPADAEKIESQPLKHLKGRNLKPQPTRPLNVHAKCSTRDEVGTVRRLNLLVKEASVQTFDAQVTMKEHGTCRFNLQEFEQVEKMPQPLLRNRRDGGCTVRMWEQGNKVTIAFNNCPRSCDGDAFTYLWPLIVDGKSERC